MKQIPDNQCRRCGRIHEDVCQLIDPSGRWAITTVRCDCAHSWTIVYTAPVNLKPVRAWLARGGSDCEVPGAAYSQTPWMTYRLEGISPTELPAAV